ncbi:Hypothetical predicted protein [Cloeon dipterum]|uniref:Uncharacterized protein n=1 Tax=Cloeon dipterum TaxID=197152 RepID=A0A8S1DT99_9INSE|nr:Hypothetical predicted protein [Cloeon dipterum]
MVPGPKDKLRQMVNRYLEEENVAIKRSLAKIGSTLVLGKKCSKQPAPPFLSRRDENHFEFITYRGLYLATTYPNNVIITKGGNIVKIVHILAEDRKVRLVGNEFVTKDDLFDTPFRSSHLDIYFSPDSKIDSNLMEVNSKSRPRSDEGREGRNTYSNSPEGAGLSNIGSEERRAITGWNPPRPRSDEGREGRSRYSNSPEGTGLSNIGSEKRQARTGWKPPRPRPDEGREGRYRYSNSPEDTGLSNIGSEERRAITGWNPPRPRSDEGREGRNTCSNSPESAGLSKNRPLQKRDRGDRETELAFFEEMLRSSQISSSSVRSSDTKRDEFPLRSAEIPIEKRCSSSVNTQKGAVGATKDISPSRATESPSDMINTNQSKENHSQKSSHEGRKASQEGSLKTSTELCAQSKCLAERIEESDGKISKSVVEAPSPEKISMNRSTEISDSAIKSPSGTLNPFLRAESTRISADGLLLRGKGLQQRGSTRRGKGKKK